MKKYSKYKDSGIEWIGEIPEHWEVVRMKYLCNIGTGDKDTENAKDGGEYPFFVRSQTVERISTHTFDGEAILTAGDGVGVCKVWHYINGKFDYHQRVYRMSDFDGVIGKYLFYYLKQNFVLEVKKLSAKSTVDSLRRPMFQNFQIVIGSLEEQTTIANYLDRKTAEIDDLIAKKERLIELYKEECTATINQAVTKGLDPTVAMKDSGIEWLGEIPAHWEVKRNKFIFKSRKTERIPLISEERGKLTIREYDYYGASGVIDKVDNFLFNEDLILIGEDGANLVTRTKRLAFIAKGKFWVNNHAHILEPKSGNIRYLCELLELNDYAIYISGSAQPKLTQEALLSIPSISPPKEEQNAIGDYLDKIYEEFDSLISKTEKEKELLKEYKTALISEVVLGKVDVREEVFV
jgi:type I restriction enzyme S subunit